MNENKITQFIIKYSIISSIVVWIIGSSLSQCLNNILDVLITPIFKIDINDDGKPDLHQLKEMDINIGNYKFPFGFLLFNIIQLGVKILIVYAILYGILFKTNLVKV